MMKRYQTTAILSLFSGNLELDEDQVRRRRPMIAANPDGTYAIMKPVQFKAGEVFGYDGDVPKALAPTTVEVIDEPAAEVIDEPVAETWPQHINGGRFLLSNGEIVKGKANAIAAQAALAG